MTSASPNQFALAAASSPPPPQPPRDAFEVAIMSGAVKALRNRAAALRQAAAEGTSPVSEHSPQSLIRSPKAACASRLAADWDAIADELEAEARF
jgi:hypothetical protein